jgi:hypothetical protein
MERQEARADKIGDARCLPTSPGQGRRPCPRTERNEQYRYQ